MRYMTLDSTAGERRFTTVWVRGWARVMVSIRLRRTPAVRLPSALNRYRCDLTRAGDAHAALTLPTVPVAERVAMCCFAGSWVSPAVADCGPVFQRSARGRFFNGADCEVRPEPGHTLV